MTVHLDDEYDGSGDEPDDDAVPEPEPERRKQRSGGGVNLLGAAMLAVGDILEPEKTTVEIVQTNDDPEPDLPFTLDFGDLPPLE